VRHVTGPLAWLQLGRAQKMMGEQASARTWYEDFLALWKDADPDVPILIQQAKAEYAKLRNELHKRDDGLKLFSRGSTFVSISLVSCPLQSPSR